MMPRINEPGARFKLQRAEMRRFCIALSRHRMPARGALAGGKFNQLAAFFARRVLMIHNSTRSAAFHRHQCNSHSRHNANAHHQYNGDQHQKTYTHIVPYKVRCLTNKTAETSLPQVAYSASPSAAEMAQIGHCACL